MGTEEPLLHLDIELPARDGSPRTFRMPITWAAARRLTTEAGVNPKEAFDRAVATQDLPLTDLEMVKIIRAGVAESGTELTEDEVGEAMIRRGLMRYASEIAVYLSGFIHGGIPRKWRDIVEGNPAPLADGDGSSDTTKSQSLGGESSQSSSGE